MSSTPDEITIEYEESGQILIKELDKVILSKGAWTTILFRYQELDAETGESVRDTIAVIRSRGEYRQVKFNISSAEQARRVVDALSGWLADADAPAPAFRVLVTAFSFDGHRPCDGLFSATGRRTTETRLC
ncbi:MAG: hypothetical protein ACLUPV_08445 [Bilophila wadsworthia]